MFFVKDYIQKGSSHSDAVERCMRARKAVRKRETVVFNGQNFRLDRAVLIPSDTEIIIDGCTVTQEDEVFDNIFRGDNLVIDPANPFGEPLEASAVENITIRAVNGGMIAGPEVRKKLFHPEFGEVQEAVGDFWGWRTFLICLSLLSRYTMDKSSTASLLTFKSNAILSKSSFFFNLLSTSFLSPIAVPVSGAAAAPQFFVSLHPRSSSLFLWQDSMHI